MPLEKDPDIGNTPGRHDLIAWLETAPVKGEPRRSKTSLAKLLGVSQPAVTGWVTGDGRPEPGGRREALCRVIGSHPARWLTPRERQKAEGLAAVSPPVTTKEGDAA